MQTRQTFSAWVTLYKTGVKFSVLITSNEGKLLMFL